MYFYSREQRKSPRNIWNVRGIRMPKIKLHVFWSCVSYANADSGGLLLKLHPNIKCEEYFLSRSWFVYFLNDTTEQSIGGSFKKKKKKE